MQAVQTVSQGGIRPPSLVRQATSFNLEQLAVRLPKQAKLGLCIQFGPCAFAILWLLIWMGLDASDQNLYHIKGFLREPIATVDLAQFWLLAFMGGLPLLVSWFMYGIFARGEQVVMRVTGMREFAVKEGELSAEKHAALVKVGSELHYPEMIEMAAIATCGSVCSVQMASRGFFRLPAPLLICFWIAITPISLGCLRFVRIGILKRQGVRSLETFRRLVQGRLRLLVLAVFNTSYLLLLFAGSPPWTPAMTRLDDEGGNPCELAANATYLDAAGCVPSTSVYVAPGSLSCRSAEHTAFAEYVSAVGACYAARAYLPAMARAYSCFLLWVNLGALETVHFMALSMEASEARRFPQLTQCTFAALYLVIALLAPLYVSILLAPDESLRGSWVGLSLFRYEMLAFNAAVFLVGFLLLSLESFLAYCLKDALLTGGDLEIALPGGERRNVRQELVELLNGRFAHEARSGESLAGDSRFSGTPADLVSGKPAAAALGINTFLKVDPRTFAMPTYAGGVAAIAAEFAVHGTESDRECLDYVLRRRAGESELVFTNGNRKRDCDAAGQLLPSRRDASGQGMRFDDFVKHHHSRIAELQEAHVLALRLYTTAAFASLNTPLRNTRDDRPPHPFPVTVNYISEAIGKLRAVAASDRGSDETLDLWRGLKNLTASADFQKLGGTELAPMSTTTDLAVAVAYSLSAASLLLKLRTNSFIERGADLTYLSAFPAEAEILFPPLTYLRPTGRKLELAYQGVAYTVLEVEPRQ